MTFKNVNSVSAKGYVLLAAIAALISGVCGGCKKNSSSLNGYDRQFIMTAAYTNNDEMAAGTLATTNGSNPAVRAFASEMVTAHETAESDLKTLASSLNDSVPTTPDGGHMGVINQLDSVSGAGFDTTYLRIQINDQANAIVYFQTELSSGQNSSVKAYATKYLPVLQSQLMMADSVMAAVEAL